MLGRDGVLGVEVEPVGDPLPEALLVAALVHLRDLKRREPHTL